MEQLVDIYSEMSLQEMALVQLAGDFWNREIPQLLVQDKGCLNIKLNAWTIKTLKIAEEKVPSLPLPEALKKNLLQFVIPMAESVYEWYREIREIVTDFYFHEIWWTQLGLVDKQRTVIGLLDDPHETLDITKQFEIAMAYCIEDRCRTLFDKLKKFQMISLKMLFVSYREELEIFWSMYSLFGDGTGLIERQYQLDSNYCESFCYAALGLHSIIGTNYFLQKLNPAESESYLVQATLDLAKKAYKNKHRHIVCFLFSHMNRIQQLETLKSDPVAILRFFLLWPWQKYFMKVANCAWEFLTEEQFFLVLHSVHNFKPNTDDCRKNYFEEFWLQSPLGHREYMINDDQRLSFMLLQFLDMEDMQHVNVILESTPGDRRQQMISSSVGKIMCCIFFVNGLHAELKFVLSQCLPSKQSLLQFRDELREVYRLEDDRTVWYRIVDEVLEAKDNPDTIINTTRLPNVPFENMNIVQSRCVVI